MKLISWMGWLELIKYSNDIILNSNFTIRRNIEGYKFPHAMDYDEKMEVNDIIKKIYGDDFFMISDLTDEVRENLVENFVIPRGFDDENAAVVIKDGYVIAVNVEDHLAINVFDFGLDLEGAFDRAYEVENFLDSKLDFAFDLKFGYLSSDAGIIGDGIDLKYKMFLFGLLKEIENYVSVKATLQYNKLTLDKYLPYEENDYADDIYIIINNGNYFNDTRKRILKIEDIIDTITSGEKKFRRDYNLLYNESGDDVRENISIIYSNLENSKLESITQMADSLYKLKKYNLLGYDTKLNKEQIDYLLFNLQKSKYQLQRDPERYEFLKNYMEEINGSK